MIISIHFLLMVWKKKKKEHLASSYSLFVPEGVLNLSNMISFDCFSYWCIIFVCECVECVIKECTGKAEILVRV